MQLMGDKIHIILDACHMLKLLRNCIGNEKVLHDGDGNEINWYFEHLEIVWNADSSLIN